MYYHLECVYRGNKDKNFHRYAAREKKSGRYRDRGRERQKKNEREIDIHREKKEI